MAIGGIVGSVLALATVDALEDGSSRTGHAVMGGVAMGAVFAVIGGLIGSGVHDGP